MATEVNPLDRINELSEKGVENLSADELVELRGLIKAEADADDGADSSPETIAHLTKVFEIATQVKAEQTKRDEEAAEQTRVATEAREQLKAALAEPEAEVVDPEAVAEGAPAEGEAAKEPVAASAKPVRPQPVKLSQVRQTYRPEREAPSNDTDGRVRATLTASSGPKAGQPISSNSDEALQDMADCMDQAFRDVRASGSLASGRVLIAAGRYRVGSEMLSNTANPEANRAAMDRSAKAQGLTASGGICTPVTIDYNIPTWQNAAQPLLDALPKIDAPRGGLQYMLPVPYSAAAYSGGVGIWSEPNDRNPGGAGTGALSKPATPGPLVKPVLTISCSNSTEVHVQAITQAIQISNFRGRFSPENVAVSMGYLEEAFAAACEIERLRQMRNSANHVTVAAAFGASRDILNFLDKVRAYFRNRYRLSDNVPLRVVLNAYVREVIRIDLRKAAFPYEGDSGGNSLFVTDAQIDGWLASVGLAPIWMLDDDVADGTHADQTFAAATAGTAGSPSTFPIFPQRNGAAGTSTAIRMLAFPEGSYQLLDGGELNLGVVRDSALNAVNEYQVFSEKFEAIAFRGFEAIDFVGDFIPDGSTAGTKTPA